MLLQCSPRPFQPAELFPLFPAAAAPWLASVPEKLYWGLHSAPLPPLPELISRARSRPVAPGSRMGSELLRYMPDDGYRDSLTADATRCLSDYLLQVRT